MLLLLLSLVWALCTPLLRFIFRRGPRILILILHYCYIHAFVKAAVRFVVVPQLHDLYRLLDGALVHGTTAWTEVGEYLTKLPSSLAQPSLVSAWMSNTALTNGGSAQELWSLVVIEDLLRRFIKNPGREVSLVWRNPSCMLMIFGLTYFVGSLMVMICRTVATMLRSLLHLGRKQHIILDDEGQPIHLITDSILKTTFLRRNGYDSLRRLCLALMELAWFLNFAKPITMDAFFPLPHWLHPLIRQYGGGDLVPIIRVVLVMSAAVDAQRVFHAAVGVRPLGIYDGCERCPLCRAVWRSSTGAQRRTHRCPSLFPANLTLPHTPTSGFSATNSPTKEDWLLLRTRAAIHSSNNNDGPTSEDGVVGAASSHHTNTEGWLDGDTPAHTNNNNSSSSSTTRRQRPGDVFPDPNRLSWWAVITYDWLNPLLNVALLSPFGAFGAPPEEAFTSGSGVWEAQKAVINCLPPLPEELRAKTRIADPAWELWRQRYRLAREVLARNTARQQRTILLRVWINLFALIRRILYWSFAVFFLPARGGDLHPNERFAASDGVQPMGLFRLFMRHCSGREFIFVCIPLKILHDVLHVMAPQLVRVLVHFVRHAAERKDGRLSEGLTICAGLILVLLLQALLFQWYLKHLYACSLKATSALKSVILRQLLESRLAHTNPPPPMEEAMMMQQQHQHQHGSPRKNSTSGSGGGRRRDGNNNNNHHHRRINSGSAMLSSTLREGGSPRLRGEAVAAATNSAKKPPNAGHLSNEGEVLSLVNVDATTCGEALVFLHNVWGHPFLIISSLLNMYSYVGWFSTLSTFLVFVALIRVNRMSASRVQTAQQQSRTSSTRMSDLNAALNTMRTVKAMALEENIMQRVEDARCEESEGAMRVARAESFAAAQTEITTLLITVLCCATYLFGGGSMDEAVLVPTIAALNLLRFPIWTFPHLFSQVSKGFISMTRVENFLNTCSGGEPRLPHHTTNTSSCDGGGGGGGVMVANNSSQSAHVSSSIATMYPVGTVVCEGSNFSWSKPPPDASPLSIAPPTTTAASSSSAAAPSGGNSSPHRHLHDQASSSPSLSSGRAKRSNSASMLSLTHDLWPPCVLHDVRVRIEPGEFVVIQGATGSGKSALLLSILGELHATSSSSYSTPKMAPSSSSSPRQRNEDFVVEAEAANAMEELAKATAATSQAVVDDAGFQCAGSVAFCAESPWLRNRSIRENITLLPDAYWTNQAGNHGTEVLLAWYERVLRTCGLDKDVMAMGSRDFTYAGEGGNKLSGGQRARVALARAVFRRDLSDIFILDDVLSALDVEVQKHIIAEVFHGVLREQSSSSSAAAAEGMPARRKTIILATHVSPDLLMPDRVLEVLPNGMVQECGPAHSPTAEDVFRCKRAWKDAAESAQRSKEERVSAELSGSISQQQQQHAKNAPAPLLPQSMGAQAPHMKKVFSLLPRREDLRQLFVEYMGVRHVLYVLVASVLMQVLRTIMDNWLGLWMALYVKNEEDVVVFEEQATQMQKLTRFLLSLVREEAKRPEPPLPVEPEPKPFGTMESLEIQFLLSFALIGFLSAVFSYLRIRTFFTSYQKIADALQLRAVARLLAAPASLFDRVPISGLLHTLSRDQEVVDRSLGESIQLISHTIMQLMAIVIFNATQHTAFLLVIPLSALLFTHLTLRFLLLTKQLRTLEGKVNGRSLQVLKDAVAGAATVRAYGPSLTHQLRSEMDESLDAVHVAANASLTADRWVALRLELVSLSFTGALAILAVWWACMGQSAGTDSAAGAAFAGLGIVSSMTASRSLSMLCRRLGMFQNQYVSVEQLLHLQRNTPQEDFGHLELTANEEDEDEDDEDEDEHDGTSDESSSSSSNSSSGDEEEEAEHNEEGEEVPKQQDAATEEPSALVLDVQNLSARYQPHLPYVLQNVTFTLRAGECVGLIGRTGNGKSSLFNALLKLMDVLEGGLCIPRAYAMAKKGGSSQAGRRARHDARMVNVLHGDARQLRRHFFQLVSQEPLLLQGTLRDNLMLGSGVGEDADLITDEHMFSVLQQVSLDELLAPGASAFTSPLASPRFKAFAPLAPLDEGEEEEEDREASHSTEDEQEAVNPVEQLLSYPISAGGSNLSAGQRQLLCLARALLHRPRVVLLDEVSSRVDPRLDIIIQRIIREEILGRKGVYAASRDGSAAGVLLIAHRLDTILALCDRVLVIERGSCVADLHKEQVKSMENLASYL